MRVSTVHNFLVVAFLAVFLTAVHRISEESSAPLTRPLALMKKITSQQNLTAQ